MALGGEVLDGQNGELSSHEDCPISNIAVGKRRVHPSLKTEPLRL